MNITEIREYNSNIELSHQQEIKNIYQKSLDQEVHLESERAAVEMYEHIMNNDQ